MIHKLIYDKLSADNLDNDPAVALTLIQKFNLEINNLDGIEYKYKSLKTLLGDNTNNWAKNKIVYEQYSRPQDASIAKNESLPRICIYLNGGLIKTSNNNNRHFEGEIKIECLTNSTQTNSILVHLIAMRIRQILEPVRDEELNALNYHCQLPLSRYSLSTFNLFFKRFDEHLADKIILVYKVEGAFI